MKKLSRRQKLIWLAQMAGFKDIETHRGNDSGSDLVGRRVWWSSYDESFCDIPNYFEDREALSTLERSIEAKVGVSQLLVERTDYDVLSGASGSRAMTAEGLIDSLLYALQPDPVRIKWRQKMERKNAKRNSISCTKKR